MTAAAPTAVIPLRQRSYRDLTDAEIIAIDDEMFWLDKAERLQKELARAERKAREATAAVDALERRVTI